MLPGAEGGSSAMALTITSSLNNNYYQCINSSKFSKLKELMVWLQIFTTSDYLEKKVASCIIIINYNVDRKSKE